jgi:hypothetical protein
VAGRTGKFLPAAQIIHGSSRGIQGFPYTR